MRLAISSCAILSVLATTAWAMHHGDDFIPEQTFALDTPAIGGVAPAHAAGTQSSRIVAIAGGALVIDADSGHLILADAGGKQLAYVDIAADAGLLAYDGTRAYVADRRGDRIVVVEVGEHSLEPVTAWRTAAEPYGVALAPDRSTLYVTAIADRVLVAYDLAGHELWRTAVDAEPRGIAISADGKRAAVGSLTSGAIDTVALVEHRVARHALSTANDQEHARGVFAIAFAGDLVVAPYQRVIPQAQFVANTGHYGGGELPPVHHALAFFGANDRQARAQIELVEPRAIAWDGGRDMLYVAGMSNDSLVQITHASQVDPVAGSATNLGYGCGADGIALDRDGNLLVWCSFSRTLVHVDVTDGGKPRDGIATTMGPVLAPSRLDAKAQLGQTMFHAARSDISDRAMLTCGTCHLDGRADGLSWRIHGSDLQTPMLAGRLVGTAPFKWDGGAKTLAASLTATVKRLGGSGLRPADVESLVAFLEATPAVRTPTREPAAVVRGQRLFESDELGCASCHEGAMLTDQDLHKFGRVAMDTPSLVGLAASAPYFHDGSAPTLDALLRDRGHVHGMASDATTKLDDAQLADLRAFLETR